MHALLALISFVCAAGVAPTAIDARRAQPQLDAALREASAASCPGRAMRIDPELTRAAQRYVQAVRDGLAAADGSGLAFYASLEATDPSPMGGVATIDNPLQADRAVGDLLPRSCRYSHAGVAAERTADGHGVVAVITSMRSAELEPIPARVKPGAVVRLDGKLVEAGLSSPRLYHLSPGGTVDETPLALEGGRFRLDLALGQPGEHTLEVLADGAGGPEVIALRRIFAGVEPPVSPPAPETATASSGTGLARVEQEIAQLRAARGLPKLTRDPVLDAVALGHSKEMARTQTFAHVLKTDGSLVDRMLRAGYAHRYAGENIGLAENAAEAHKAIEQSPAHLMNLLDPRHSRLGLGAALGVSPDGDQAIYLTEVLAQPIINSKDPAAEVAEVISAERKRRKLPPLVRDPRLDALAQARIRKVAAEAGRTLDPDITSQTLEQIGSIASASAERLILGAPEDAKISKDASGRDWAVLGVGAVYASSKEYGPDRLWVLLLYAR